MQLFFEPMDTRTRIIEESAALFMKQGIRGLTMSEIAQSMGISKRTLYEHFSNKEELLAACMDFWHQDSCRMYESIKETAPNPLEVIHQHFKQTVIVLGQVHPNLISDIRKYHPAIWQKQYQLMQETRHSFTIEFLEQGKEQGFFRKEINNEIASRLLYAQVDHLHDSELFPPQRFSRADVFREIIFVFLRGICSEKGIKEMERIFETPNY